MRRFCAARHSARYPHLALQFAAVCYDVRAMKKKLPPPQITHVLFDWDGTLINSYAADLNAYVTMFAALEIAFSEAQIAEHYSPNWYRLYRAAKLPRKHWPTADALWTKAYGLHKPPLLPGARRVVQALGRTHTLGIVTSGNRARVRRQLREFNLRPDFKTFVASEDVPHKKPHPAPLRSSASAQNPINACTSATPPRIWRWPCASASAPSASSAHFPPRNASAPPAPRSSSPTSPSSSLTSAARKNVFSRVHSRTWTSVEVTGVAAISNCTEYTVEIERLRLAAYVCVSRVVAEAVKKRQSGWLSHCCESVCLGSIRDSELVDSARLAVTSNRTRCRLEIDMTCTDRERCVLAAEEETGEAQPARQAIPRMAVWLAV